MSNTTLTTEDYDALRFSNFKHGSARVQYQMRTADDTDYYSMVARERVRSATGVNHTFRAVDSARRMGLLDR